MTELHGQLPLFEIDLAVKPSTFHFGDTSVCVLTDEIRGYVPWKDFTYDETCDDCGTACATTQQCLDAGGAPGYW